jgi:hypothetical protein
VTHEFNHCTFVKPSVARILFAKGEKEYHAAKEQPEGGIHLISSLHKPTVRAAKLTEGSPGKEENPTMFVKWIDDGELLSLSIQRVDGWVP